ncbi:RlpA-like double-psi beta-barrel-protein domain-containing protein-containing protein [Helicostylum pulchrum]|nr:RlpA-like double-psi beta-barrel-protein domain-containing protein-containing protein [Helicostylum pulchrum]
MSRTLALFTIVALALSGLSSSAPLDSNSLALPIENNSVSVNQSSSGGSSSSGTYTGTATWFKPASEGGSQGACGPEEDDDSYIVALNAPQYGNMSKKSSWCGKKVKITGPKGSVVAVVNDACPGCSHGDLDLTPILFKQVVGDMNIGVAKISWYEV